ncbi:MAG: NAD(P)/FAD-dependent oxidoreductase [Limnochordia bacterium]
MYDVIIVGAGPAGIFAALELSRNNLRVLMLEKGLDINQRSCPMKTRGKCIGCQPCGTVSGWGGAGAFSDGKLTLATEVGGWLNEYMDVAKLEELIAYVDGIYCQFGAPKKIFSLQGDALDELKSKAVLAELRLVPAAIRHLGSGRTQAILAAMQEHLLRRRVDLVTNCKVHKILIEDGRVAGVETSRGTYRAGHVIVAPGREGAEWLMEEMRRLGLSTSVNPVDIGVRVELPYVVTRELTDNIYESKLVYHSRTFNDRIRTFCVCPQGEVALENNGGVLTVNGHSHAERKTENTNFALLVSKNFTEPFREPIAYGKHIARLANLLGGGVLVQRLGDLLNGRRSTPARMAKGTVIPTLQGATPGDLSLVLPYRYLVGIIEMLQALDKLAPGVYSRNTLLYGVEVKFYSSRLNLSTSLETEIPNLFAAGDGAGITRGLMQASVSGVVAARSIMNCSGN